MNLTRNPFSVTIIIRGQVKGGKNNMGVTRSGRHYPKTAWEKWRNDAVQQVRQQYNPSQLIPFAVPVSVKLNYVAGDKRRRDQPAVIDALWHVLEKSGVVTDDTLLWVSESTRSYDKANPRAEMTLTLESAS